MHIWLLTHSEELKKANGTGQLITNQLASLSTVIIWQRTEPAESLLNLPVDRTLVIYPSLEIKPEESICAKPDVENAEHFIILDGTWQQARKMYNRSPYLHQFQTYEIQGESSQFIRRRNQQKSGLCTAESAIYLLRKQQLNTEAQLLENAFLEFNSQL